MVERLLPANAESEVTHDRGHQRHGDIVGRGALACVSARAVSFNSVADCITSTASAADCTCVCANSRASACARTVSFAPTDEALPALEECNQVMTQIATLAIDLADLAKQEKTELEHEGVAHGPM